MQLKQHASPVSAHTVCIVRCVSCDLGGFSLCGVPPRPQDRTGHGVVRKLHISGYCLKNVDKMLQKLKYNRIILTGKVRVQIQRL